ncbi:hypothetical protein Xen7305DRAFT_00000990 [Xenococcus sp. PCC 7305]|uniref:hypothetical protein n=1 Tax=Xenococcus sp. PCC 7305 TaxID=102125 RepID=UPI0002ACB1D0|nr:hypothetical protein [Xenococcus sp. PCC 7305]ELS00398.1 hypothetical protein Xen7305DRAFT_00000990 [Xenococcus sp. PCC 7305]
MSWRLKLSNWLSDGALSRSQKQAELAKAKLKQQELTLEKLHGEIKQERIKVEQLVAQLQISQGFQVELGETQQQLRKAISESEDCRQKLPAAQKQLARLKKQLQKAEKNLSKSQDWLEQLQSPIRVAEIQKRLPKQEFDTLWGFGVNSPEVDTKIDSGSVLIKGWALGRRSPVAQIQISYKEHAIVGTPVNLSRPEVTNKYPEIPKANKSGFEMALSLVGMPSEVELELQAILKDETVLPLCAIFLKRED